MEIRAAPDFRRMATRRSLVMDGRRVQGSMGVLKFGKDRPNFPALGAPTLFMKCHEQLGVEIRTSSIYDHRDFKTLEILELHDPERVKED